MTLSTLAKQSDSDIVDWVRSNAEKFNLISDHELEKEITQRDYWEEKATELANGVGLLLKVEVGEHSNINCPVTNALEALDEANHG